MTAPSERSLLYKTVEKVLREYAAVQINLLSAAARKDLAEAIVKRVYAKFYAIPLSSQETFEE